MSYLCNEEERDRETYKTALALINDWRSTPLPPQTERTSPLGEGEVFKLGTLGSHETGREEYHEHREPKGSHEEIDVEGTQGRCA